MPVMPPTSSLFIHRRAGADAEEEDIWFDTVEHQDIDETEFARCTAIPLTEDCRRCIRQLICYLGEIKQNELISAGVAKLLPGAPIELIMAADALYIAVTQGKNIDVALLNVLGLTASLLPADANTIALLARFVRNSVLECIGESFLGRYLSRDDNAPGSAIFTALAVLSIVARYWITDDRVPQRRLLRLPAFVGKLLLRVNLYWNQLSRLALRVLPAPALLLTQRDDTPVRVINLNRKAGLCPPLAARRALPDQRVINDISHPVPCDFPVGTVQAVSTFAARQTEIQCAESREVPVRSAEPGNQRTTTLPLLASAAATLSVRDPSLRSNMFLTAVGSLAAIGLIGGGKIICDIMTSTTPTFDTVSDGTVSIADADADADADDNAIPQGIKKRELPHAEPRWAKKSTTVKPILQPQDVRIEQIYDFTCVDSRANLSWPGIIRQIGVTLVSPAQALAEESQIIHSHNSLSAGCPRVKDKELLKKVTAAIDMVMSQAILLLPGAQPFAIAQQIIGPALQMIADDMDGSRRDINKLSNLNNQLLFMSRQTIPSLDIAQRGQMMKDDNTLKIPTKNIINLENGNVKVNIKGKNLEIYEDANLSPYVINQGARYIYFDPEIQEWLYLPFFESAKYSVENIGKIKQDQLSASQLKVRTENALENDKPFSAAITLNDKGYKLMNGKTVPVREKIIHSNNVIYSTRSGLAGRIIIHGESGYYFERESTSISRLIIELFNDESLPFSSGLGKTAIKKDGFSYDNLNRKYLKYKENYYLVNSEEDNDYLENTIGEKFYLNYKDNSFSIQSVTPPSAYAFILLRDGHYITRSLANRLSQEASHSIPDKINYDEAFQVSDHNGNQYFNIENKFYQLAAGSDMRKQVFLVKNRDATQEDIAIYRTRDDFIELKQKERKKSDYVKESHCMVRRSPVAGPSSCSSILISTLLTSRLNHRYRATVDESNLAVFEGFPNTFIHLKKNKLYFKTNGMYFRCEYTPRERSVLQKPTLQIIYINKFNIFRSRYDVCRIVQSENNGINYIISEEGELVHLTGMEPDVVQSYLFGKIGVTKGIQQAAKKMRKENKLKEISFINKSNQRMMPEAEIRRNIRDEFFRGRDSWNAISLHDVNENMMLDTKGGAYKIRKGRDLAHKILSQAKNELDTKSKNALTYLAITLNTTNRSFIYSFMDQLSAKYIRMRDFLINADIVLCYSRKKTIELQEAEEDPIRDNDWQDYPDIPWENVHSEPTLSEPERDKGTLAFTLSNSDERIWLNLDAFYFVDPTHPDISLRRNPVIEPYLTLLHESAHKYDMAHDIIYAPLEKGTMLPILDSIDILAHRLEKLAVNDFQALTYIVFEYMTTNHRYRNFDADKVMNGRTLKFLLHDDPHFRATLLLNIPDFLTIMARDLYQNREINF